MGHLLLDHLKGWPLEGVLQKKKFFFGNALSGSIHSTYQLASLQTDQIPTLGQPLRLLMSLVGRFIAYYDSAPVSAVSALSVSAARGHSFTFLRAAHRASTVSRARTPRT